MQKVINKAKKLFDLAYNNGATEHEAALALQRAKELLAQYDLTEAEVYKHTQQISIQERILFQKKKLHVWDKYLLDILVKYFDIKITVSQDKHYILAGTEGNIEIAEHVYNYLKFIFKSMYKSYKTIHKHVQSNAYYFGVYSGLCAQLDMQQARVEPQIEAVQLYKKDVNKYIEDTYGKLKMKQSAKVVVHDKRAYMHGEMDGKTINLYKSIKG